MSIRFCRFSSGEAPLGFRRRGLGARKPEIEQKSFCVMGLQKIKVLEIKAGVRVHCFLST